MTRIHHSVLTRGFSDRFAAENSPAIAFRAVDSGRPPAQDRRRDKRPVKHIPRSRRGTRAVARGLRGDGAHRRRVVRATEHDEPAGRGARRARRADQGPEVLEHADVQHPGRRVHGRGHGALRSGFHPALQPRCAVYMLIVRAYVYRVSHEVKYTRSRYFSS